MWIRHLPSSTAHFRVYLQGEERKLELIREVRASALLSSDFVHADWITFLVALPTRRGFHQIVIRGVIDSSYSFLIDDLTVRPCYDFGEYV
jgi:hypothetical protein